jgi:DtxR family Mn-dependent transcriptional regulator
MVETPIRTISESAQMYLVKIKRLEGEMNPVPLSYLAESLSISPVSVNEMCRKMQELDLIDYQPYKGASLTPAGDKEALRILRRHRLWEVFLVDHLRFSFEQAHELADALEHVTPGELADRLDFFLGNPRVSPDGNDIPASDENVAKIATYALTSLAVGQSGYCLLEGMEDNVCEFLAQSGLRQGQKITLAGKTADMLLLQIGSSHLSLGTAIAQNIQVIKNNPEEKDNKAYRPIEQEVNHQKENNVAKQQELTAIAQVSLDKLKVGQSGTVVKVSGTGPVKQRLMDMGLVPGSEVEIVRVAPLGDPMELKLKGYNLSVRRNEAKSILVEMNPEVK